MTVPANLLAWPPSGLPLGSRPSLELELDGAGQAVGAVGVTRLRRPPTEVYAVVRDVARFGAEIPMIHHSRREGDRVTTDLKFKVALFSARFSFTCDVLEDPGHSADFRYVAGEPRDIRIRFDLMPLDDGASTLVRCLLHFDVQSLGWLVKLFLRHHPEIRHGVYAGSVLVLLDALHAALGERPSQR